MKVSIIIPVFNEQKTIAQILKRVFAARIPSGFIKEIIVVNDASTDRTLAFIPKSSCILISHPQNLGKGAAIRTGLNHATGDVVLIQDADLEYDPRDYLKLLTPFKNVDTRVVYGSRLINYPLRFYGPQKTPMPVHWLANHFLTLLTNLLFNRSVTDMETCYKAIRRDVFLSLRLKSNRFDIEPEITAKILQRGIKIIEVPIKVNPRSYAQGKKIGWRDGLIAVWTLIKYKFVD
ncbi:MAG: Glycosyltransferases involved in cell wall bioproteini [Microgenomates group bacterium Gr01-1014_16]|nr:MAG: Glycosyltransferases involved in cell wall bioproteini [Microgenomates group bacterium Gr01-1014_16]